MPKINTAHGQKDSAEASKLFAQEDQHDTSFLLGVYHQLLEKSHTDAVFATKCILENPDRFNHKLIALAKKHQFDDPVIAAKPAHVTTWPNLGPEENRLLTDNQHLFYDESLFCRLCTELGHADQADQWARKISDPNAPMDKVLTILPFMMRTVFLERYIQVFAQELQV